MRNNNNWDVCPNWVRFQNDYSEPDIYTGWDVCPHWVRFTPRTITDEEDESTKKCHKERQKHVHEFLGSTTIVRRGGEEIHNHRFAGVSGEAIPTKGSHIHRVCTKTDFFNHFHEIDDFTGPAVEVGNGKHVHFASGETTFNDGHEHDFQFSTLIENPIRLKK